MNCAYCHREVDQTDQHVRDGIQGFCSIKCHDSVHLPEDRRKEHYTLATLPRSAYEADDRWIVHDCIEDRRASLLFDGPQDAQAIALEMAAKMSDTVGF